MQRLLILILFIIVHDTIHAQRAVSGSTTVYIGGAENSNEFSKHSTAITGATQMTLGTVVSTKSYSTNNDLGGSLYEITNDTVTGYPVDGIAVTNLGNGKYLKLLAVDGYINGNSFGLNPNGVYDNSNALNSAILYAQITNNSLKLSGFSSNSFNVNSVLQVTDNNIKIISTNNFTIKFNSAVRNCIEVGNVNNVNISGINFKGSLDTTVSHNAALFLNLTKTGIVSNCYAIYSPLFLGQNRTQDTINTVYIKDCVNENFLSPNNPGSGYIITGCKFLLSDSTYLDRKNGVGSSHAIYGFADRRNVIISNCMFKNIRIDGIKCSGSTGHVNNWVINGNTFDKCGTAITIGGDVLNDYPHRGFIVTNNIFRNCFGQRLGWTSTECTLRLYACDDVTIDNNLFSYNTHPSNSAYYTYTIRGNASGKKYMSNLRITNNRFYGVDVNNVPTDVDYNGKPIYLVNWNQFSSGELVISNNTFEKGFQLIIQESANVRVENNVGKGSIFLEASNCAYLIVKENTFYNDTDSGIDRCVIYSNISWLNDSDNKLIGFASTKPSGWAVQYNGIIQGKIPLTLKSGITFPTFGKPIAGFWYGSGWETGDYLLLNGTQIDYNVDFTTPSTLINYINTNISGYKAFDLNDSLGIATTNFIIIQRQGTPPIANIDEILLVRTSSYTACVTAMEGIRKLSGSTDRYIPFRGGGNINKIVIFSPYATQQTGFLFEGLTSAETDFLKLNALYRNVGVSNKPGVDGTIEFEFDSEPEGSHRFIYYLIN